LNSYFPIAYLGKNGEDLGQASITNPDLGAVQDPALAIWRWNSSRFDRLENFYIKKPNQNFVHMPLIFNIQITAASDPLAGSVKQKQAISSPVASLGKYFSFCSLFPAIKIPLKPIDFQKV
jgi:hypothetical protein